MRNEHESKVTYRFADLEKEMTVAQEMMPSARRHGKGKPPNDALCISKEFRTFDSSEGHSGELCAPTM